MYMINYKKLAQAVVEAEKSCHLQVGNSGEPNVYSSLSPHIWEPGEPGSVQVQEKANVLAGNR